MNNYERLMFHLSTGWIVGTMIGTIIKTILLVLDII